MFTKVPASVVRHHFYQLFSDHLSESEIAVIFEHLSFAERSGKSSHGFARTKRIVELLDKQAIAEPITISRETAMSCHLDCRHNLGYLAGMKAVSIATEKLKRSPMVIVGGANTDSLGVLGYYTRLIAEQGYIGIATTTSVARIPLWGDTKPVSGTNPLAIAFPHEPEPIVYDAACAKTSVGAVLNALNRGECIAEGLVKDQYGNDTQDPNDLFEGSLVSEGRHKGAGLAFMLELLAGPLVGAPGSLLGGAGEFGFLFIALAPDCLVPMAVFNARKAALLQALDCLADGGEKLGRAVLPGHRSAAVRSSVDDFFVLDEKTLGVLKLSEAVIEA